MCVVRSAAAAVSGSWTPALLLHITSFWSIFFLQDDLFSALSKSGLASLTCNEDIVPRYYLSCPTPDSLKLLRVKCMGEMLRADRTFILFYSCLRCCQRLRLLTISCDVDLWEGGEWGRWSKGHCTKGSPFLKCVVVGGGEYL